MATDGRLPTEQIDGLAEALVTALAALPTLAPLTATVGGVPDLVWDANDELVLMEVVL